MQMGMDLPAGEQLRRAMRRWVTGVAVVTSHFEGIRHGMTVNSFGSISLDPPLVTVTMNNDTRTYTLVQQSGVFAVTVLYQSQQALAELFAGRMPDHDDNRLAGLDTFILQTGAPLLGGGLAFVDCRVVHVYAMPRSTLFVGEVLAALTNETEGNLAPLVYVNRTFTRLGT